MCPGVDSASKNWYQDNPGGKGGRCVRLKTYQFHVPIVKKYGDLKLLEFCGSVQDCKGAAFTFYKICVQMTRGTICLNLLLIMHN